MKQQRRVLVPDGLTSGLKSDAICVHPLELADSLASLEKRNSLANVIEVSGVFFRSFNASSDTPPSSSNEPVENIAAVNKRTAQPYKASNRKCGFFDLEENPRTERPAR